jgi:DNA-binding transcriptional regulator LsrR (DeoR family)
MIIDPTKLLLENANEEAKRLQRHEGRPEKGIISTQVRGLAIAWGKTLESILDNFEPKKRKI